MDDSLSKYSGSDIGRLMVTLAIYTDKSWERGGIELSRGKLVVSNIILCLGENLECPTLPHTEVQLSREHNMYFKLHKSIVF